MRRKTGFEVEIEGDVYAHVDYLERSDITILPTVYVGGYKESLVSAVYYLKVKSGSILP